MPNQFYQDRYEPGARRGDTYCARNSSGVSENVDAGFVTKRTTNTVTPSAGVSPPQQQRFDVLLRRQDNRECFDCGAKQPRWASTNLGIFFCLRCAGIHRSMGTHISKVKSVSMDAWPDSMLFVMEHVGNTRGRLLYEYNMPPSARVAATTDTAVVERAIRGKYERRQYFHPRFTELFKKFMESPNEGVCATVVEASAPSPRLISSPRQADTPVEPPHQHNVLVELWGPPVSSTTTVSSSKETTQSTTAAFTNVEELFSGAYRRHDNSVSSPAVGGTASPLPTAWGSALASPSSVSPVGSKENWAWARTQLGEAASNACSPLGGGMYDKAPLPNKSHSLSSPSTGPSNTDNLFMGFQGSPSAGSSGSAKDEILSLFGSAPVLGAGVQTRGSSNPNTGGGSVAWQPQMAKPLYHPG